MRRQRVDEALAPSARGLDGRGVVLSPSSSRSSRRIVEPLPLTAAAYAPYGDVIEAGAGEGRIANQGRARVFDRLVSLQTLARPNGGPAAAPNLSVFRCAPWTEAVADVDLLEKHPFSTQVFIPMAGRRSLVIVARGDEAPDLSTLAAFIAGPTQGIAYQPGTWHHPMIALDVETDFACLVWEDGTAHDTVLVRLHGPRVPIPPP